jgi:hypothetical protein
MIYFLHIPRTSGSAVISSIAESFSDILRIGNYETGMQIHNDQKKLCSYLSEAKKFDYIGDHFATMPYLYTENIDGFSLVRNPIERLISCFNFFGPWDGSNSLIEFVAYKSYHPINDSMGFNGRPNMQCANLVNTILWEDKEAYLENTDLSFFDILKIIKKQRMTLSTYENRNYMIKDLNFSLNSIKNTNIILNTELKIRPKRYFHEESFYLIPDEIIEEIKALNALDYELYNYIKSHEIKTGRALSYKDIII